tara:strand:+ start:1131 stop:1466 length:336 start_codon:yes stop_codon:yes gene_type:complete
MSGGRFGRNIAHLNTTSLSDNEYRVAGFYERQLSNIPQFTSEVAIGTQVSNRDNANRLDAEFVGVADAVFVQNTTNDPGSRKFTITDGAGNYDPDGTHIKSNDPNVHGGSV